MDQMDERGLSHNNVALGLSKSLLLSQTETSNVVFSPMLIELLLNLIAAGSKGTTLEQLLLLLKSETTKELCTFSNKLISTVFADASAEGGPRLLFANGVWIDKSLNLKSSFKEIVDNVFKATSTQVDFQTQADAVTSEVNAWAEKEMNGIIKEILASGSVDNTTRLILTNALYFKGDWKEKFDASATRDYDFHLLNGSTVSVPFMTSFKKHFIHAFEGFKVLGLPHKQGEDKRQFSMYIFLPNEKQGLPALVDKATSEHGFFDRHLPQQKVEVGDLKIPKFKISFGFEASEALKRQGFVLPFSSQADLSEMVDSSVGGNLLVSSIFHKSMLEVNEEGSEAAAASAADMTMKRGDTTMMDFAADHPFLFLVREDKSGVILFIGQMLYPLPF
ncbi:hypothetical protein P3X46_002229 [Hevea brasiliensis]|uniref:Serpin domain-containing protein n=1 Tax=Hevea brasiliensis TaxID=3981 RepID=A0ABQ9N780_HEVBR|nr:serpin-ZX-like [Hevea brasiliensis]KAJ9186684.1 hypothetical protein P3X46_002229 [Hevea brasiliensis]